MLSLRTIHAHPLTSPPRANARKQINTFVLLCVIVVSQAFSQFLSGEGSMFRKLVGFTGISGQAPPASGQPSSAKELNAAASAEAAQTLQQEQAQQQQTQQRQQRQPSVAGGGEFSGGQRVAFVAVELRAGFDNDMTGTAAEG
jgi:hypothetical protein